MSPQVALSIIPSEVIINTNITVRTDQEFFEEKNYMITDKNGRIIRKGSVSGRLNEIKLSLAGLAAGVYCFTMGALKQQFTIVYY